MPSSLTPQKFRRDCDRKAKLLGQLRSGSKAVLLGCVLGALFGAAVGSAGLIFYEQRRITRLVHVPVSTSAQKGAEIDTAFARLNELSFSPCSEAHLAAMRAIVFQSSFIRDAIYQEGPRLRCSSGLGEAVALLPERDGAQFVTTAGRRLLRNIELSAVPGVTSTLVSGDRYGLLVAPNGGPPFIGEDYFRLSVLLRNAIDHTIKTISGPDPGLDARMLASDRTFWRGGTLFSVACVPRGTACFVLRAEGGAMLRSIIRSFAAILFAGAVFLGLVLGGLMAAAIMVWRFRSQTIEALLRRAVSRDELFLQYQPIVDAQTGAVVSAEALMRWTLPSGENVPPDVFIPIAEEMGVITDLTCLALRRVSRDFGEFLRRHRNFKISVNIVSQDLADQRFHAALSKYVEDEGILPTQIALELTERHSIEIEAEINVLQSLHARGYGIYIDDFGTGYSNLSYLSDLTVQMIKLDKSFTDAVCTDSLRARMVPAIIDIAKELGLDVIVEGVSSADQVSYFHTRGVNFMQGWFFSPAIMAERLIADLSNSGAKAEDVRLGQAWTPVLPAST